MTLKKYIETLQNLLKEHPESAEFKVVAASDDEGNDFNLVQFDLAIGKYEDREFTPEKFLDEEREDARKEAVEDGEEFEEDDFKPNAVCVN